MKSFLKFIFGLIVVVALLAVIGKIFFFELVQTSSYSMVPNLVAGDLFAVHTGAVMGLGDLAVCEDPDNPDSLVVLRIVGIPGSTVSFWKNHLRVDGDVVEQAHEGALIYVDNTSGEELEYAVGLAVENFGGQVYNISLMDKGSGKSERKVTVPDDHFFLAADNRNMGRDSRNFGPVPIDSCIGRAVMLIWPGEESGDIERFPRFLDLL